MTWTLNLLSVCAMFGLYALKPATPACGVVPQVQALYSAIIAWHNHESFNEYDDLENQSNRANENFFSNESRFST